MESTAVERAETGSLSATERVVLAVGTLVFLSCFPVVLLDLTPDAIDQYDFRVLLFPTDLAIVAVGVVALRRRQLNGVAALAAVFGVALLVAYFVHPSLRGTLLMLRWSGVVALAALADRRLLLGCIGTWSVFEAVLALAQKVNDGPLGLPRVLENEFSFVQVGEVVAPPGSMVHAYLLAALALLGGAVIAASARPSGQRWRLVVAAVAVAPVGFTYSRTAVVGLAAVLLCFAIARFPTAVVALAIGVGVPATVWSDGWVSRARTTIEATSADEVATARGVLTRQSLDLIGDHPATGVGPGLYVQKLHDRDVALAPGRAYQPVHNLPLLAAAEGGVAAGIAMLALLLGAAVAALRRGPLAWAIFGAFVPFLLLDHFAYTFPQGNVMLGLWLGAIAASASPRPPRPRTPAIRRARLLGSALPRR